MNKCYMFVLLLILSISTSAQIKKKSILLGGELNYYNDKTQIENLQEKYEGGSIGISIGKAFKENSVVGFNFSLSPSEQTYFPNGNEMITFTNKRYDIGVFYREYKNLGKDFYFFAQADGAFIMANQSQDYSVAANDVKASQRGGYISLTPGISYQVFKKMHLELTIPNILIIQYAVTNFDNENPQEKASKREQFYFSSNLNSNTSLSWLGVGFRFIL
jgi:hypothetical protein